MSERDHGAVGPLVFAFMLAGVAGASLLVQLIGTSDAALGAIVSLGTAIGLDATTLFVLLHALGFAPLGWFGLRRVHAGRTTCSIDRAASFERQAIRTTSAVCNRRAQSPPRNSVLNSR